MGPAGVMDRNMITLTECPYLVSLCLSIDERTLMVKECSRDYDVVQWHEGFALRRKSEGLQFFRRIVLL